MKIKIGIDEAGRGPIAGPVSVAAFSATEQLRNKNYEPALSAGRLRKNKLILRDSKKLSAKQRDLWFTQIKKWKREGKCDFAVTLVSAKTIDRIGISKAISSALIKSLFQLQPSTSHLILLDGLLSAPKEFKNQKTIIKGDEKIPVISLASIVAKVTRDRHMMKMSKKFPKYDFEIHKGYGTKGHYHKIKMHGLTPVHRKSFLRKFI
jgi:ribonuclease HII